EDRFVEVIGICLAAHEVALMRRLLAGEIVLGDLFEVRNGYADPATLLERTNPVPDDIVDLAMREVLEHVARADLVDRLIAVWQREDLRPVRATNRNEAGRRDLPGPKV